MSVTTVLQTVGGLSRPLVARDLRGLSGMQAIDRRDFLETWAALPLSRRAEIAQEMTELAEENVDLDLRAAWSWLLDDQDPTVRTLAVEGLWEDTSVATMRRMLAIVRQDPDDELRAAAAIALSRFAYLASLDELDEGAEALERTLAELALDLHAPQDVRRRALESAGYFAENTAVQAQIANDYATDEQLLRESALVAMGRSMRPSWLPTIARELGSESPAMRYEAARAAGEMAEEARSLLGKLAPLMNDRDTEIALAAIWSLGQIGGESAERVLLQMSKGDDEIRSQAATDALEELRAGAKLI